jgi:hypothetical protein
MLPECGGQLYWAFTSISIPWQKYKNTVVKTFSVLAASKVFSSKTNWSTSCLSNLWPNAMFGRPDITASYGRQLIGRRAYFYTSIRCQSVKLFSIKRRETPQVIRELSSLIEKNEKMTMGPLTLDNLVGKELLRSLGTIL